MTDHVSVAPAAPSRRSKRSSGEVSPFLKWAGGKRQLLESIFARLPAGEIRGTYFEPFVGGGAVFFELARRGWVKRARLSDCNEDLVVTYRAVKDDVEGVIAALERHRNEEAYYYEVRAQDPSALAPAARAARTIFLNRVGFNGLYRVNASGKFNVPFGRYRNPNICAPENLRAASRALACAEITVAGFEEACADAGAGDVAYLDPPYLPLSRTANFTAYSDRFGVEEHRRLALVFASIVDRGAVALLSNSDTELSRELYSAFKLTSIEATRAINSKADRRGVVSELLVQGLRI
jgi:DNA adenine methylase